MKIKKKLKYILLLAFIASLVPYTTEGIPKWEIVVLDKEGKRVEGIEVVEEWQFSRIQTLRLDRKTTDKNGEAIFPARVYVNSFLFRVVFSLFDYFDFIMSHFNPLCPCGNVTAGKAYRSGRFRNGELFSRGGKLNSFTKIIISDPEKEKFSINFRKKLKK